MNKISLAAYVQFGTGVQTVKTLKKFIDIISLLEYRTLYLGIGENFKVKNQPYLSYMRGRYEASELKEIACYAKEKGIETIPAIQTLGHFHTIPCYSHYKPIIDHHDVLLIDEEATYAFLEDIISTCADIFGKGRLMIGGDEAHLLGSGKYYDKHGNCNRMEIFIRHCQRVAGIAAKYGLSCEMWSDMFFKLNGMENYESGRFKTPQELLSAFPKDITIVHWSYGDLNVEEHVRVLKEHKLITPRVKVAGAFCKYLGFAPNNTYSIKANKNLLAACGEENIPEVIFTMWEDNGGEASIFSVLPSLFEAAVGNGNVTEKSADEIFLELTGMKREEFLLIDYLNYPYFQKIERPANCSFYYLYADPFIAIFNSMVTDRIGEAFADYAERIEKHRGGNFGYIFEVNYRLALVLEKKAKLGVDIKKYYRKKDVAALKNIAENVIPEIIERLDAFFSAFDKRWKEENMPGGFEVHCARIGALKFRLQYAAGYLLDYCEGRIDEIRDLEDETLTFTYENEAREDIYALMCWNNIITAGVNW